MLTILQHFIRISLFSFYFCDVYFHAIKFWLFLNFLIFKFEIHFLFVNQSFSINNYFYQEWRFGVVEQILQR